MRTAVELERDAIAAVSADRIVAGLAALVAVPSVTGTPAERVAADLVARQLVAAGSAIVVERRDADPVALARDPAYPGTEMPREVLPLVAGSVRAARRGAGWSCPAISTWCRPATRPRGRRRRSSRPSRAGG